MPLFRSRFRRAAGRALALGFLLGGIPPSAFSAPPAPTSVAPASVTARQAQTKETWMGLYMGPQKIGYTRIRVEPTTYKNRPALRTTSEGVTKLSLLGTTVEQREAQETLSDLNYQPLSQTFDITSSGSGLRLEATYDYAARKVFCRLRTGESGSTKTLTIPRGANLAGDTNLLTEGKKLSVGQKLSFYYLNPVSVALEEAKVEIAGREAVKDPRTGKTVSAFVVKARLALGEATSWETEDGDTIKGEMGFGGIRITMRLEPKEVALNLNAPASGSEENGGKAYVPPADFMIATAIATDKPIENPRRVSGLTVLVSGVPDKQFVFSDDRQKAEILPTANAADTTVRFEVTAKPFDATKSVEMPVTKADFLPYLQKAAYLDTDDPAIQKTALALRGQEKNLYRIACRLRDWVHKNMTPDPSIGVPRSASDIFGRRRGVCRDYATLYATLARAAGVPTRLCSGIVYADGRFFYHAWAESYVGEWVAFDPTLHDPAQPQDYVDATHIKFAQGDVTSMFNVVAVIGRLRITVQKVAS
ncbi:MAG TPA: transglutaminase-like domain-containing protein [Chthonomonadaceae bacterium]|nr:transglutaminase-like domain-containing protein [Chthonomonadaceae bacterium]